MKREFALSLLTEKRDLLSKIISYNGLNEQVELPSELADSANVSIFTENHSLMRKLAKVKNVFFDFENRYNRLCFLDANTLERLQLMLSASLCSFILLSDIKKDDVLTYREYLGADIYNFGLRRGSLYIPAHVKNRVVETFSSHKDAVRLSGCAVLSKLISKASYECQERTQFSLEDFSKLELSDIEEKILFDCIVKIICLELDESCQNIFS